MSQDTTDYRSLFKRALQTLDELKAKLEAAERPRTEPIAVIGMGCRFPSGADDPEAFWKLLREGANCVSEVPADRWDVAAYYDPTPGEPGKMYTRRGGFLTNADQFDPHFFGIAPREAISMDPQQRVLLEVAWEALEDAGLPPARLMGSATGVFVGISAFDYATLHTRSGDPADTYFTTGTAHSIAAGRLSYVLGLHGPNLALDTACSSSLVAVHLACQSLRSGESRMALAAGVNMILSPDSTIATCQSRMMAPDGLCKTFDAAADGYVRGEGCGVVVLKMLSDALADGDRILALIRGTAVNQDGRSSGITAPSGPAQEAVIREVLSRSGVAGAEVDYVEAHGTGTALGDPIEVRALAAVLGQDRPKSDPLLIGSVKTNIGHLESAAGMAGLIKVILALRHEEIPAHLHLHKLNPLIPWDALPLQVVTERVPWRRGQQKRIASVSSFGFSGTNAHMLVEEAPLYEPQPVSSERPLQLLTLSAKTAGALEEVIRRYRVLLDGAGSFPDLCYSASAGRAHFSERIAVVAASAEGARATLDAALEGREAPGLLRGQLGDRGRPQVAFLFTGQGAQYPGMGRQLFETQPSFRRTLEECDEILAPLLPSRLLPVLLGEQEGGLLDQTAFTQPALFSLEYALATLWRSWGIEPALVLGHSVGEYSAACVAGVFSLEDGLKLIAARGRLMQALPAGGQMAAVFADEQTVASAIRGHEARVSIAAINGPANVVLSGEGTALQAIVERLRADGVRSQGLTVSHAFHSPLMDPMLAEFERAARGVSFAEPRVGLVSNLMGRIALPEELADPPYWRRHVREAVRFAAGMQALGEQGCQLFLEVGPHPTLLGMGARCLPEGQGRWLPSLRKGREDWGQILESLGSLYTLGVDPDWVAFERDYPRHKVALPTYPFQRESYWLEAARRGAGSALRRGGSGGIPTGHPLLGLRLRSPLREALYETELAANRPAFLRDHAFFGRPIFPGAGYVEMALAASGRLGEGGAAIEDLGVEEALQLDGDETQIVHLVLSPDGAFQVFSLAPGDEPDRWRRHATGRVRRDTFKAGPDAPALEDLRARCPERLDVPAYYALFRKRGVEYGAGFQGLEEVWSGSGQALARVRLPAALGPEADAYRFHPVVLDAGLQLLGAALWDELGQAGQAVVYMPTGIKHLRLDGRIGAQLWVHTSVRERPQTGAGTLIADLRYYDDDGRVVAEVEGLEFQRATREALEASRSRVLAECLYELAWEERPAEPSGSVEGSWLVLGDAQGYGTELATLLEARGAHVVSVRPGREFQRLETGGYQVDPAGAEHFDTLLRSASAWRGIVHLWGLDAPPADHGPNPTVRAQALGGALHLAQAAARLGWAELPRLWLVTRGALVVQEGERVSLEQAPLWGLGRTIALEHPELRCTLVDIEASGAAPQALLAELLAADGENQIAHRRGVRHVARLGRVRVAQSEAPRAPEGQALQLQIPTRGVIDNLKLVPIERRRPGRGELEIRVAASGLNFRDVLNALGMYPGDPGPLGGECAGRIVAVGEGVEGFQVGDEVMAMCMGSFATYVTAPTDLVARKPHGISLEEAASIPIAYLTAHYGLNRLAGMKPGERVLIHAAAGGVGMAAVQLAQRAKAEIFATAGSHAKRELLTSLGVPHIMDSRSLDFAEEIKRLTAGEGIDIVLNSLSGAFIPKSLSLLRKGGRFLEIGKRGIWDAAQVEQANPGVAYHVIYLGEVAETEPSLIRSMLEELVDAFAAGALRPGPIRVFPIRDAVEAFRYMAQAKHVGKIVVRQEPERVVIRPDATYLVTGGLGALGLVVARWLVEHGARHLALVGRRGPADASQAAVAELEQQGARVVVLQADVADEADVARVLDEIEQPPLKGVVHAAGVLDDGVLLQQDWTRFERVMAPKVEGGWHLHALTRGRDLDFLVFFSSMASLLGSPGQGNYAAANAFLDALAAQRRAEGLPGLSINWGPWGEIGMAAAVGEQDRKRWAERGVRLIAPDEGAQILGLLLRQHAGQVAVVPFDWPTFLRQYAAGAEPPLFRTMARESAQRAEARQEAAAQGGLQQRLEEAPPSERHGILLAHVREQVAKVLGLDSTRPPSLTRGLTDMGMDSLMVVELRNRLQTSLGAKLPSTLVFEHPTIEALSTFLAQEVLSLAPPATGSEPEPATPSAAERLEELSQKELSDSLLKELKEAGY